jgi:hypothetical protein
VARFARVRRSRRTSRPATRRPPVTAERRSALGATTRPLTREARDVRALSAEARTQTGEAAVMEAIATVRGGGRRAVGWDGCVGASGAGRGAARGRGARRKRRSSRGTARFGGGKKTRRRAFIGPSGEWISPRRSRPGGRCPRRPRAAFSPASRARHLRTPTPARAVGRGRPRCSRRRSRPRRARASRPRRARRARPRRVPRASSRPRLAAVPTWMRGTRRGSRPPARDLRARGRS